MKNGNAPRDDAGPVSFEALRGRIESTVKQPGVVVVTSAIARDGKGAASHGLAVALGLSGYRTLLIEVGEARAEAVIRAAAEASLQDTLIEAVADTAIPTLRIVSIANSALRRSPSLQSVAYALAAIRGSYDYIVVNAGCALQSVLASHFVSSADAVLVAVRAGRRRHAEDLRLSERLGQLDALFFGVVALNQAVIDSGSAIITRRGLEGPREVHIGRHEREPQLRNVRPRLKL
jgi:Mrp family chromosome partitioning ATPase